MLEWVEFHNFRCFKRVRVPLRPLTVLIGQNDTGKSSFLHGLVRLVKHDGTWGGEDRGRGGSDPQLLAGGRFNSPTHIFSLPSQGVALKSRGSESKVPQIEWNGSNIPALVDFLLRKDRNRFNAFVNALKERIPGLDDVNVDTPTPDTRAIELFTENGFRVPPEAVSSGVRLLIFFVALVHHPDPPRLILIEEPENGLHPRRLADVIRLLKGLSKSVQIVLTTHSPLLLDEIDVKTDQVLIFKREADGNRTVEPADEQRLKLFLDEFKLGEVWFNEGEQGLVKKAAT